MLAMIWLAVVSLAGCTLGTLGTGSTVSNQDLAGLEQTLDNPRCLSSLRHIGPHAESLGDELDIEVLKAHARRCEGPTPAQLYWIVRLRLAAYAARSAAPLRRERFSFLELVAQRPKIGRFGMCLPLSCLEAKSVEERPSKTALGLIHWFTFHVLLPSADFSHSADSYPPFEATDIKSITRCCNPIETATCRSVTEAKFPILRFFEREGVPEEMIRGLRVANLGSFDDGYGEDDGLRILLHQGAKVFGFDSPEQCEKTNRVAASATHARCGGHFQCIGRLIADGAEHRFFYLPSMPFASSLYQPNQLMWRQTGLGARAVRLQNVSTARLDDVVMEPIDFLKMDIQGAELLALSGAERALQTALVVQAEVGMDYLYRGQPLFPEIDRFLRQRGFTFHRLLDLRGLDFKLVSYPVTYPQELESLITHQQYGDAVYVRGVYGAATDRAQSFFKPLAASEAIRAAWILHEFYQSYDMALHLLNLYVPSVGKAYFLELADSIGLTNPRPLRVALTEMNMSKVLQL